MQQKQIINTVVNIFQNVGIKRWIDQIQSLRNQQIYFQICKIIFPQTMIRLFKINQSNLTPGQKIQQVIDIIARIIKLDLYHISGQAIAQGNLNHLRNLLKIFQQLSNIFITNNRQDIQSAPDRDQDNGKSDNMDQGFYTVLGVPGEFYKQPHTDQDQDYNAKQQESYSSVQEKQKKKKKILMDIILNIININIKIKVTNKKSLIVSKTMEHQSLKEHYRNHKEKKNQKMQNLNFLNNQVAKNKQVFLEQNNHRVNSNHTLETPFQKKKLLIGQIIQQLQQKKIYDQNHLFKGWEAFHKSMQKKIIKNINQQAKERNKHINKGLTKRQKTVAALSGQQSALRNIVEIFKQQKKLFKQMKQQKKQRQLRQGDQIMNQMQSDQIKLQQAILSSIVNYQVRANQ